MSELPDPLVPAEVDLQDFPFMPLQVARLRDSDLAAEEEPETCWYAVLLWAASWHQIPAGSLPDNDTVLMRFVGLGRDARTWKKHREGALRGFQKCSDGRFYHRTVAEQALEAWQGKIRQRHRTFCASVRKHNERNPEKKLQSPTFEEWEAIGKPEKLSDAVTDLSRVTPPPVTRETPSKGQGQGQGQGDSSIDPKGSCASDDAPLLELQIEEIPPPKQISEQDVVDGWNELASLKGLPLVRRLTDERRRKLRVRLREYPDIDDWKRAFKHIHDTPFLCGENRNGWRANFDFLLQASSFTKLTEEAYGQAN